MKKFDANKDVLLLGAGGHCKVIVDAIKSWHGDFNIIGVTDNDETKFEQTVLGIPIIGNDGIIWDLFECGLRKVFISIGMVKNYHPRNKIYHKISDMGFELVNVIHGTSIISKTVTIGKGNAILAGSILNTEVKIGDNCIVNSGSIIEHECIIGNNVHIAPGVSISGQVSIEDNCMIGVGASLIQGVRIGEGSIVGAGSVVTKDIPPNCVAVGAPAKVIREVSK